MANGLDTSKLVQHMDKIAYAVAGGLAVVVLLIPLFSGGEVQSTQKRLQALQQRVDSRRDESPPEVVVRDLLGAIEKQWIRFPPSAAPYPRWSTERIPSVVQWIRTPKLRAIKHGKPSITRIEYHRHPEKLQTYLKVVGKFGERDQSVLTNVKLFRREGDGPVSPVLDFDDKAAIQADALSYDDFKVKPGEVYAYTVQTEAARSEGTPEEAKLDPEHQWKQSSDECAITEPVPWDYYVDIIQASPYDPVRGIDAGLFGFIWVADFENETDKPKEVPKNDGENSYRLGFEFGPLLRDKHIFKIRDILEGKVVIADRRPGGGRETLTTQTKKRNLELPQPTDCTAEPSKPEPTGGEAPGTGETAPAPKGDSVPEAPPSSPPPEKKGSAEKKKGLFK